MIRPAKLEDKLQVIDLCRNFYQGSSYKNLLTWNEEVLKAFFDRLMSYPEEAVILVSEGTDGKLNGMITMFLSQHFISGEPIAMEACWWVNEDSRGLAGVRLLRAAEKWAKDHGAVKMQMVAPNDRVAEFYEAMDYSKIETNYQRTL